MFHPPKPTVRASREPRSSEWNFWKVISRFSRFPSIIGAAKSANLAVAPTSPAYTYRTVTCASVAPSTSRLNASLRSHVHWSESQVVKGGLRVSTCRCPATSITTSIRAGAAGAAPKDRPSVMGTVTVRFAPGVRSER